MPPTRPAPAAALLLVGVWDAGAYQSAGSGGGTTGGVTLAFGW